jgi:phage tail sheath protein FI
MIAHCELMGDRVAILDPPPGLNAQQIKEWRVDKARYDSKYATLYWPWIKVFDPATRARRSTCRRAGTSPASGAATTTPRGVHKAPANEVIRGAVELETQITKNEHGLLNPTGINCIRAVPRRRDPRLRRADAVQRPGVALPQRARLFNFLEESILNGTQWVVFEPNDDALWARIRRTVNDFLVNQWRAGALFGLTPDEAFFVKCDRETNPSQGIDAGEVVCMIGVAPVKPAEFVVFRLSQFSGGTSLVNE